MELHHRLLTMKSIEHDDGGSIVGPDALPTDEVEETTALAQDINLGLVSKKTAALQRGYDYDQEQELIKEEKSGEENLLSLAVEAARNRATLGEISDALEAVFGRYKAQIKFFVRSKIPLTYTQITQSFRKVS